MRIANGVEMLEIESNVMGKVDVICPTLLWDEETVILVDAGYPGQVAKFREAIEGAGVSFEKLNTIIMTHQDMDHIGSLPAILDESLHKIEVLANELEKPYIQGEKMLLKITPEALANIDSMIPAHVPEEWRNAFKALLQNPPKAPVDRTVEDGEQLPFCGGITIINTPGHTPGHISLYHQPSKTLIAGDALIVGNGQLLPSDPRYTHDMDEAIKSIQKLTQYDIETVICYHGGLYRDNVNQRIAELANG
jgi:glyoxylase-like metal-dependent hydrolase (beta-lactamase superfamily II)